MADIRSITSRSSWPTSRVNTANDTNHSGKRQQNNNKKDAEDSLLFKESKKTSKKKPPGNNMNSHIDEYA